MTDIVQKKLLHSVSQEHPLFFLNTGSMEQSEIWSYVLGSGAGSFWATKAPKPSLEMESGLQAAASLAVFFGSEPEGDKGSVVSGQQ